MSLERTINKKGLAIVLGAVAFFGVGVHLVHGFQIGRVADDLLAEASQAETNGDALHATECLASYLELQPGKPDVQARYGLLLKRNAANPRDLFRALGALDKALEVDGERTDLRKEAAESALQLGETSECRDHLTVLMAANPKDADLLQLRARCEARAGEYGKANDDLTQAIGLAPHEPEYYVLQAALLRQRLQKPDGADQAINNMVKANPRSVAARMAAARYYSALGQRDPAEENIRFALTDLKADQADAFELGAQVARAGRDKALTRKRLEEGLKKHPDDAALNLNLAQLEVEADQPAKALNWLRNCLRNPPTEPEKVAWLAQLLIQTGEKAEVTPLIERLRSGPASPLARHLDASLAAHSGDWTGAAARLQDNLEFSQRSTWASQANLLLAQCYQHLGNFDGELEAYRRILQTEPLSGPANTGKAQLLARLGRIEEAIAAYRLLVPLVPEQGLALARLLLRHNLDLPAGQRRWDEVEQVLAGLPSELQTSAETLSLRASLLGFQGHAEQAQELLQKQIARQPKDLSLWLAQLTLAADTGKADVFDHTMAEAQRQVGARMELALAQVRWELRKSPAEARKGLAQLEQTWSARHGDYQELWHALAVASLNLGERAAAQRLWRRAAQQNPSDVMARLRLLELPVGDHADEDATRLLAEIKRIEGGEGGPLGSYGEASQLLAKHQSDVQNVLPAARQLAAQAAAARPTWAAAVMLQAQIEDLSGNFDKALEKYQQAIELGERRVVAYRRAVDLLVQRSRYSEAHDLLRKIPDQALVTTDLGKRAAEVELLSAGPKDSSAHKRAFELAQQSVPKDSRNSRDYVWLGQMAAAAGETGQAEQFLRRALTLDPKALEPWAALAMFFVRTEPAKASATLAQAEQTLPADVAPLTLAPIYIALGELKPALKHAEKALGARPTDPAVLQMSSEVYFRAGQRPMAEQCLRKLLDPKVKASPEVRAAGRRSLAQLLATSGNYASFKDALALLKPDDGKEPESHEDQKALARVLATQPSERQEAIQRLENLEKLPGYSANDRYLLATLYEEDGDWPKSRAQMQTLLGQKPDNGLYLTAYLEFLLKHHEDGEAALWLDKLQAMQPQTLQTLRLRALILAKSGQTPEATRQLRQYLESHAEHQAAVAAILDEVGQTAEAEAIYRRLASLPDRPENQLLLAAHLGNHGRVAEALQICEPAWRTCRPEMVASTIVAILRNSHLEALPLEAVQRQFTAALKSQPQSVALHLLQAELYELQGQYADAMGMYRAALQLPSRPVVALNNLAWLLALKEGNATGAITLLQEAVERAGPTADILDTRGVTLLVGNNPGDALKDLQSAVRQRPSASEYFHLAQACERSDDLAAARQALRKAKELGLQDSGLHPLERESCRQLLKRLPPG
jgi:tetratricopeptide (TPR) repeat protein